MYAFKYSLSNNSNLIFSAGQLVIKPGMQSCILPIPATTTVGLKLIDSLAQRQLIPQPQVIYLDSAHEEGEVLLELRKAWRVLAPGGVLFGDDWRLQDTCRDVLRFASTLSTDLDDEWPRSPKIQSLRRLGGRVRPGLFISHDSAIWFMKKSRTRDNKDSTDSLQRQQRQRHGNVTISSSRLACWNERFSAELCCESFGPRGNPACFDKVFTFNWCCNYGCIM